MKKILHFLLILFFSFSSLLFFPSCNNGLKTDNNENNQTNEKDNNDNQPVEQTTVNADSFFWGTWVRMDNGNEYEFLENSILWSGKNYGVSAFDINSVTVKELGKFNKESDSVIVCDNIPYFRKGGTNLEYSLKLVGFISSEQQMARAAGSVLPGVKGKGKSKKYKTFEDDSESDVEGIIKFKAPTVDDIQTVTITTGNDIVVIPELYISNSGDYMGTVALVGKNDYNLKITGTVSDSQKDGGYLYGNNAKSYELVLTITNISENKCKSSVCTISTDNPNLNLSSETNLQGFTISTLEGGATKTLNITVSYGTLTEPYINTGINIKLTNPSTGQEWVDYIPLRFFKGTIPITISAKNPENNKNAALNGFIIYPDGNNQFFAIPHNSSKPVFVPTFGKDNSYKLVFSGATVTSKLDDSTEMYYTVEPASLNPRKVVTEGDAQELIEYMNFGGDNHSETTSYSVTQGFESYLSEGEIDYYTISADSDYYYSTDQIPLFEVSYENEKGASPDTIYLKACSFLTSEQLPELECEGFEFLGWYDGEKKVVAGNEVNHSITLEAKWISIYCSINYQLSGGTFNKTIVESYTKETDTFILEIPERSGYTFDGWYRSSDFRGVPVLEIKKGSFGDIILYAKWNSPDVGDIVLGDGRLIKAQFFNSDIMEAVAVLYYVVDGYYGVGIYNSGETLYEWCSKDAALFNTKFSLDTLGCYIDIDDGLEHRYSLNSFKSPNTNPCDNWDYICSVDDTAADSAEINYPAFYYINNYKNCINSLSYKDGWYLPSARELIYLSYNIDEVNNSIEKIGGNIIEKDRDYWSCSGINQVSFGATAKTIDKGYTVVLNPSNLTLKGYFWDNSELNSEYYSRNVKHTVCAVRKFEW